MCGVEASILKLCGYLPYLPKGSPEGLPSVETVAAQPRSWERRGAQGIIGEGADPLRGVLVRRYQALGDAGEGWENLYQGLAIYAA